MRLKNLLFPLLMLLVSASSFSADKRFVLVIDAGHGGKDAGAIGAFSKEKNINLNVALKFGRMVEQSCSDVKVIYTRKTDVFVELEERANIANRNKADLFISIHTNALPNGRIARGLETYTMGMARAQSNLDVAKRENAVILVEKDYQQRYEGFNPNSSESYIMFEFMQDKYMRQSVEMAKLVQTNVCNVAQRANKGVHQAGFLVLRNTTMPSCLIELGFISTPDEEQYLNSEEGTEQLSRGIFQAFLAYKNKDNGFTVPLRSDSPTIEIPQIVERKEQPVQEKNTTKKVKTVKEQVETPKKQPETKPLSNRKQAYSDEEKPLFKVQITTSSHRLDTSNPVFKGVEGIDCYEDNGMIKYTCGCSADFAEISRLRKTLLEKFPEAFVVAFKNGKRIDMNAAVAEYKRNIKK